MQINITGHHIELTPALRSYIETKFERVERHIDQIHAIHVILTVEKSRQKAEATLQFAGASVVANAEDENMYAALDALVDKLDRQLLKHKNKMQDHHRVKPPEMLDIEE